MAPLKELGDWLAEDTRRQVLISTSVLQNGTTIFKLELGNEKGKVHSSITMASIHGVFSELKVPFLKYEEGDHICEACFKVAKGKIPEAWHLCSSVAICGECAERIQIEGLAILADNYGRYATTPDPRKKSNAK